MTARTRAERADTPIGLQLAVGAACLLIGIVLVVLVANDDGGGSSAESTRSVLRATGLVAAGTDLDLAVADGLLVAEEVASSDAPADAAAAGVSFGGQTAATDVPAGTILALSQVERPNLRAGAVEVPEGMRAVAIRVPFVAGIAGYAAPGDKVDVYATVLPDPGAGLNIQQTRIVVTDVAVLDVSQQVAPLTDAATEGVVRTTGQALTYLLAVTPDQAEALVFTSATSNLHLVLVGDAAPPINSDGYSNADLVRGPARGER